MIALLFCMDISIFQKNQPVLCRNTAQTDFLLKVNDARKRKNRRLKQAKEEAQQEQLMRYIQFSGCGLINC